MDIDVGPNAPGSNFSRLERHSADRRIGPASLNHHPNRQRPAVGSRTTAATPPPVRTPGPPLRPRHNEMYTWGRNDRLGYIPQAHSCSPHIHFTNMEGVRSPVTQSTGLRGPASPTGGLRSPRNAIHRCFSLRTTVWVKGQVSINWKPSSALCQALNRLPQHSGPPNQIDIGHSGSRPLDPRRHDRLWNAFAVGKN